MKSVFILVLSVFTYPALSQDESIRLYEPNHFTVSLKDGLNKSNFTPTYGTEKLDERYGHIFQMQFDYTINYKNNFGLLFRNNVGISAFTFDLKSKEGFAGTEGWNRFYRDTYNTFAKLGLGVNFHKQIKPNLFLNINLGAGVSVNSNVYYSTGSSIHINEDGTLKNQNYDIDYSYSDDLIGYGFMDLGINYVLKNKNLIGLSISPEVFFKPTLSGSYSIYNNTSGGKILNSNNNIALSLNYTFTQFKKHAFEQFLIQTSFLSKRERKKIYKKDKRFVDPKSIFISGGSGLFFVRNIVNDPNNKLLSNSFPSWTIYGNADIGIKNQFYYSFGVEVSEYWSSIKFDPYGGGGSNIFIATKLKFGISKRFISSTTNRNYFNLYTGVSISIQPNKKGISGWGYGELSSSTNYYSYSEIDYYSNRLFPTLYMAIEKDLHLTKNLYLSIKYKYDQGFISATKTDINYKTSVGGSTQYTTSKINGTAHTVSFGFKYKISPNK